jgi:hypothetical protein
LKPPGRSAPPLRSAAGWGLCLLLLTSPGIAQQRRTLELPGGATIEYQLLEERSASSARPTATRILTYLAAGDIGAAAALSNAPKRREEVLRDYLATVGEIEFRRVYGQYFFPENRIVAEIAIGERRLLIWKLGEAGDRLTGQFYVRSESGFVMDDIPTEQRSQLQRVLRAYRAGEIALKS